MEGYKIITFEVLSSKLSELYHKELTMVKFDPEELIFEERVGLKCFYCARYDTKWSCPPRIPQLDYPKIVKEYENGGFVICKMNLKDQIYEEVRTQSTNGIHKALLYLEKVLWELGNPMALTFIGGSCKLCKNGCAKDRCRNPKGKRIPVEAIGINVIESLKKVNVEVDFVQKVYMQRVGLILW